MVIPMVSEIKIAVFMVGVILAFVMPIFAIVKVRKKERMMRYIMMGVICSFSVSMVYNLLVVFSVGVIPDLFKDQNNLVNFLILFTLEVISLFVVLNVFRTKFLKGPQDKMAGLALSIGYLVNFTIGQVMMNMNYFLASFAINQGQLDTIFEPAQVESYMNAVVGTSGLYYLANGIFIIVVWLIFTKLFSLNMGESKSRRMGFLTILLYSVVNVTLSIRLLPALPLLLIIVVVMALLSYDFRKTPWTLD